MQATHLPVVDAPYWEQRAAICHSRDCSDGDVCLPTEAKNPGRSSIARGTLRKDIACPKGHWGVIRDNCRECGRKHGLGIGELCVWCENTKEVARQNADIRARRQTVSGPKIRLAAVPAERVVPGDRVPGTWAVAVTTAPRRGCTLGRCLDSMMAAGWSPGEITVHAEPGATKTPGGVTRIDNEPRLGVWHNWLASCRLAIEAGTDYVLTVQDDSLFHPGSRELIESINWPDRAAFVSLYTPSHYSFDRQRAQWNPVGIRPVHTRSLWGSLALVWRPDVLANVIAHPIAKAWLGFSPRTIETKRRHPEQIANSDTAIGNICNAMGLAMYFVDPSPVAHIAQSSTIPRHGGNSGRRNAIRIADHSIPLQDQINDQQP